MFVCVFWGPEHLVGNQCKDICILDLGHIGTMALGCSVGFPKS